MDPSTQPEQTAVPTPDTVAVTSPEDQEPEPTPEPMLELSVKIPGGKALNLVASPAETVGDIKQNVIESPESCMHSCFYLQFNGERLSEFAELNDIEGLVSGSQLVMVRDQYTDREVRAHVCRLRDLLIGPFKPSVYDFGIDAGATVFSALDQSDPNSPSAVAARNGTATTNGNKSGKRGKKNKGNKKAARGGSPNPSSNPAPTPAKDEASAAAPATEEPAEENAALPDPVTTEKPKHIFNGHNMEKLIPLQSFFPKNYHRDRQNPQCLAGITVSGWNPVPQFRKLQGDLLYLNVTTLEGPTYSITGAVSGFFVNQSTPAVFNPAPRTQLNHYQNHSLISLLTNLSPRFQTQFKLLQNFITSKPMLEVLPGTVPYVAYPWCVKAPEDAVTKEGSEQPHTFDASRASESYLNYGIEASDSLRDWNDELQTHRELPRSNLQERVLRDRLINKVQADFAEAAAKGAMAVVEGNVTPLNPLDTPETHMFIYNNIFFSKGLDGRAMFADIGGDAAAHVATGKDLEGVRLVNSIDLEGACTLGTVVVDYRGTRVVAQSIVPGIFRRQEDSSPAYGSVDSGVTVSADPQFHELAGSLAKYLHLAENTVVDAEGKSTTLFGSIETKGITGADGRKYLLDLFRLNPIDIEFQEAECGKPTTNAEDGQATKKEATTESADTQSSLPDYPHHLTLLRPELVDLYWEHKSREFQRTQAEAKKKQEKPEGENATAETTTKTEGKEEPKAEKKEDTKEAAEETAGPEFELSFNPDVFCAVKHPETEAGIAEHQKQEGDVRALSQFLRNLIVPGLVADLISYEVSVIDSQSLSKLLHRRGVNLRYLGRIAQLMDQAGEQFRVTKVKSLIYQAMVTRALKHILRDLLADLPAVQTQACVAHVLNCLLGDHYNAAPKPELAGANPATPAFATLTPASLRSLIQSEIAARFRYELPASALEFDSANRIACLRDLCLAAGLQIAIRQYHFEPVLTSERPTTFLAQDILNLVPRVKDASARSLFAEQTFEAGRLSLAQGQRQLGVELLMESLALHEQTYGFLHPETGRCYAALAMIYHHLGEKEMAQDFQKKAIIISERTCGLDDPDTIHNYLNLGLYEHGLGNTNAALACLKHAMGYWQLLNGTGHPDLATVDNNVAVILQSLQDFPLSCRFFERAQQTHEKILGPDHTLTATSNHVLAKAYALCGDFKKALQIEKNAFRVFQTVLGDEDPKTKESNEWLQELTAGAVMTAKMALSQRLAKQQQRAAAAALKATGGSNRHQHATSAGSGLSSQLVFTNDTADSLYNLKPTGVTGSKGHLPIDQLMSYIMGGPGSTESGSAGGNDGAGKNKSKRRGQAAWASS
ncbi:Intracellular distribution of mitochondria [Dimargaris cristalligena]|nr:Intracellular distribution of mitochondria [Dimargaris cristalligena]